MHANDCHSENEKLLAHRLVAGDIAAFDEIYRRYFHPVYNNAFKITRDAAIAEDILQEVFITLWEKRTTVDPEKSLAGWLFVVAYHRSINVLRRRLKESVLYQRLPLPDESSVEEEIKFGVQWSILENALERLSPQRRRVFELCKLQGKTYEEAAMELHISKYTVKEYLSAALVTIKEYSRRHPESSALVVTMIYLVG
jgi:RNA polymerase sigma-70 factor (family 1)